jgi:hypothetical protein
MNHFNRNVLFRWLIILFVIFEISCTANKPPLKIFIAPGFTGNKLNKGGLAVFPVFIDKNIQFIPEIENYAHTAGEELTVALKKEQPELKVIDPTQFNSAMGNDQIIEAFSKIKKSYAQMGMVNVELAQRIGELFKVQYLMVTSIDSLFGFENVSYKPQAEARISAKIYDISSSEIVLDVAVKEDVLSVMGPYPYERAIKSAYKALVGLILQVYNQK